MSLTTAATEFTAGLFDSPRTQATYRNGLASFTAFMADRDPYTDCLKDFRLSLAQRKLSRFTQQTYLAATVGLLKDLLDRDLLPADFSLEKARLRANKGAKRGSYPIPQPDQHLPQIIAYYDRMPLPLGNTKRIVSKRLQILRARAFVKVLYSSAGRLSEVASLNRNDVGDGTKTELVVTGKGGKERFLFLTAAACKAISAYLNERKDTAEGLFISHGRDYGKSLSNVALYQIVVDAAKSLGLNGVHPHSFRHYRASEMLNNGAPLEAIQEILGHTDISTTQRVYAHYSKPAIRAIFDRTTLDAR